MNLRFQRLFGRIDGIAQKARDGHGTHASGHGSDPPRDLGATLKVAVADIVGPALDLVVARIHHDRSRLDPVPLHHLGTSDRGHDDVGFADQFSEVLGSRVSDRHGRVLFQQHQRRRFAQDDAAADHDRALTTRVNAVMLQESHDAQGSRTSVARKPRREASKGLRSDAVNVLFGPQLEQSLVFIQVLRKRMLDQHAMDGGIGVERFDLVDQLGLGRVRVDFPRATYHAGAFRPFALHADVRQARGILRCDDDFDARYDSL